MDDLSVNAYEGTNGRENAVRRVVNRTKKPSVTPHRQRQSLRRLLEYAWERSRFYRDYYESHGIRREHLGELSVSDLPLLSKDMLIEHFDQAVTDPRLRKAELEEWIQQNPDPRTHFAQDFVVVHTSGTSGTIAVFPCDEKAWRVADIAVASHLPLPPNPPSESIRAAFYTAAHGHFAMVSIAASMRRPLYETLVLSVLDARMRVVERLNAFKPQRLYGYASSVADLARLALEGALRIRPEWVLVSGDKLTASMEATIREAWHAPIHVTYGASESKYIAVKRDADDGFAVLDELNIVEVLDEQHRPVLAGTEGRVVITNLYNFTLPIIRYQFDDYVVVEAEDEGVTRKIRDIRGRVNDALPVVLRDGVRDEIHPIVLSEFHVPHLQRIQFISQSPGHVCVQYVASVDVDEAVTNQFQRLLDRKGAVDTTFEVTRVREISGDAQSGKLQLVRRQADGAGIPAKATHVARPGVSSEAIASAASRRSVHGVFEDQAHAIPNSTAIACGDEALTYSQLNAHANQLAWHLRSLGVEPGSLVGVCVPRSIEMAVAILGILKAGGAWVPLDQRYPLERQSLVLEDAGISVLVTEDSIARALPRHSAKTVLLDSESASLTSRSASDLPDARTAGNLAYVMYTSGSTGRPKGVMITHANVCDYVHAMRERLAITGRDVYLHTASMAFSSSVRQLLLPLLSGARVVVATPEQIQEPLTLLAMIRDQQVTVLDLIPSYWRICIDALAGSNSMTRSELLTNKVRLIVTASEPLSPDLPKRWRAFGHGANLMNMFGLTETTGIVATYTIPADYASETATVPIGYPLDGTRVYLFDEFQNEVPAGGVGELFVAGPGVGLGYRNQPDETTERFRSDPLRAPVDRRLFRTGDLARFGADGSLEFHGRLDDQIKIRGIRIELAEIESALRAHPSVEGAVVIAMGQGLGERRAVAYVVPARGSTLTVDGMRTLLGEQLPEPMIPSAFVILDSFPRLPNGKLDREALPVPTQVRPQLSRSVVLPRTATEWKLARIWEAVLTIVGIGITDNFFDLGGNSLTGLYMLAKVRDVFGKHLPATAVLQAQTIEEMAKLLQEETISQSALIPLQPHGSKPPFFWIHGDNSDAFLPRYLGPDQPLYALVHQSQDGNPARFTTVEEIARHYLEEIRTVQPSGPYLIGGFCFGALVAFEIAHQLRTQGDEVRRLVLMEPSPLRAGFSSSTWSRGVVTRGWSWKRRVRSEGWRHLQNLRRIDRRDRLNYVWLRTIQRLSALLNRITSRPVRGLKEAVCWTYHRFGTPLPYRLRSPYILGVYRRATHRYAVRTYPGSVSLFVPRHALENPTPDWKGLTTGAIEIHEIPDGHEVILNEPHVRVWAEKLRTCLMSVQA